MQRQSVSIVVLNNSLGDLYFYKDDLGEKNLSSEPLPKTKTSKKDRKGTRKGTRNKVEEPPEEQMEVELKEEDLVGEESCEEKASCIIITVC